MSLLSASSQWIKKNSWVSAAVVMILLAGLAYLPFMTKLGIYRDDWHIIFGGRSNNPSIFIDMFSIDRPFVGWNFTLFYRLLGENVLYWNIAAFFLRITGGLCFLGLIRRLWPSQSQAGLVMGALFIVYPGFLQQSDAITYVTHLTYTLMLLFSMLTMVIAIQLQATWKKIIFILLSLFSTVYYFLLSEYVIGIEGLRFALLVYLVLRDQQGLAFISKVKLVIKNYWPYFITVSGLLIWRLLFFYSERPTTDVNRLLDGYLSAPVYQFLKIVITSIRDFWEIAIAAWSIPIYKLSRSVSLTQKIYSLVAGFSAAGFVTLVLWLKRRNTKNPTNEISEEPEWAKYAVRIGAFGLIFSILSVVVAGRDVQYESILNVAFDRYTLHAMPAAILLLGGLLYKVPQQKSRSIFIAVMVAVGVSTQLFAGSIFADAWESNRQFWWQLSWRAPQLKEDTMLIAGFADESIILEEYQISYPGTIIYYPGSSVPKIGSSPATIDIGEKVVASANETKWRRNVRYSSDFSKTLIAYFPTTTSCLHIVDGRLPMYTAGTSPYIEWLTPYSSLDQIDVWGDNHIPPTEVFGPEPELTWCYYYQKASLAAQAEDWDLVNRYAKNVEQNGLKPVDLTEWMPFIMAHVNSKEYDSAREKISYIKDDKYFNHQVCKYLDENVDNSLTTSPEGRVFLLEELCTW